MVRDSNKSMQQDTEKPVFSDTDDDEQDYFDDESDANLSREERYVLLHPRAEPQGQENLSGNVTPVNDAQRKFTFQVVEFPNWFSNLFLASHLYEKVSASPAKLRYSSASTDSTHQQQQRYSNTPGGRSISVDHPNNGSQRNSLIIHQSNRNSMDQPQSNRSSLDVSQSSYNTLIIHDNNETQQLFSGPSNTSNVMKQDLYFLNSSPSPPNHGVKKNEKVPARSMGMYSGYPGNDGKMISQITENEQQYLNQSYVLKHLAREVKIPQSHVVESTRDSGVSENNSTANNQNWSHDSTHGDRNKSKSQPDLTQLAVNEDNQEVGNNSETNTLNMNDFEQLEVENNKLRVQLMKVAKSQKVKFTNWP